MRVDRHAAAVVDDRQPVARLQRDLDPRRMARDRLVHRIVEHFGGEVVQRALVGAADIHARAAPDGLEPLQHLDRGGVVIGGRLGRRTRTGRRTWARYSGRAIPSGASRDGHTVARNAIRDASGMRDGARPWSVLRPRRSRPEAGRLDLRIGRLPRSPHRPTAAVLSMQVRGPQRRGCRRPTAARTAGCAVVPGSLGRPCLACGRDSRYQSFAVASVVYQAPSWQGRNRVRRRRSNVSARVPPIRSPARTAIAVGRCAALCAKLSPSALIPISATTRCDSRRGAAGGSCRATS